MNIRVLPVEDQPFFKASLYLAIPIRSGKTPPDRDLGNGPELTCSIENGM
jgi:hypothetical protein